MKLVSIHATLAGGDTVSHSSLTLTSLFLSTPPSRVATSHGIASCVRQRVSIHATLAGGDHLRSPAQLPAFHVSIHATLAGGDFLLHLQCLRHWCFYPRHPRGWRRIPGSVSVCSRAFLSTPPSRVATEHGLHGHAHCIVSIHATLAGGDVKGVDIIA